MKEFIYPVEKLSENLTAEERIDQISHEHTEEDARERRNRKQREYYWKNREKMLIRQREYYASRDKEKLREQGKKYRSENKEYLANYRKTYYAENREYLKEQVREYQQKNKDKRAVKNKEYREKNKESLRVKKQEHYEANKEHYLAYLREYRDKNRETLRAKAREKWAENKERHQEYSRAYRAKNKEILAQNKRKYYENNKYKECNHRLNFSAFNSIERVRSLCPDKVEQYMLRYPFGERMEHYIKVKLRINGVYPEHGNYADCYDAGMLAYLYSIHRCAVMGYEYVLPYIKKMVGIYIICALIVYDDTKNICKTNGFRELRLDADRPDSRF